VVRLQSAIFHLKCTKYQFGTGLRQDLLGSFSVPEVLSRSEDNKGKEGERNGENGTKVWRKRWKHTQLYKRSAVYVLYSSLKVTDAKIELMWPKREDIG